MYQFLVSEFEKLNKKVPNIHYGGCCVFAEELYNFLVKLGKKPRIIAMSGHPQDMEDILKERWYSIFSVFDIIHTVILVDGILIDNNGMYKVTHEVRHCDSDHYVCMELTLDELHWMNNEVSGWNSLFNRDQIIDITKKIKYIEKKLQKTKEIPTFATVNQ